MLRSITMKNLSMWKSKKSRLYLKHVQDKLWPQIMSNVATSSMKKSWCRKLAMLHFALWYFLCKLRLVSCGTDLKEEKEKWLHRRWFKISIPSVKFYVFQMSYHCFRFIINLSSICWGYGGSNQNKESILMNHLSQLGTTNCFS